MHTRKTTRRFRTWILLPAALAVMMVPSMPVAADIVPGTSSTDIFDAAYGTTILDHDTIVDPINVFRTSGGFEDGHTIMRNGGVGSVSFIEFETGCVASVDGLRFFAQHDSSAFNYRRALNNVKVLADTDGDGSFETTVADQSVAVPYGNQPGNAASDSRFLDLTLTLSAHAAAQRWRLETTQATNQQPFEGPRVVELDASGACKVDLDVKPNGCPNPLTLLLAGTLPVAIVGTAGVNVNDIDVSSVRLQGVAPRADSARIEDVMTPYVGTISTPPSGNDCLGGLSNPADGTSDLTLKFSNNDLTHALCPGVSQGDVVLLTITGSFVNGGTFKGQDVVRIQGVCPV